MSGSKERLSGMFFFSKVMYVAIKIRICYNAIRQKVMMSPFGQQNKSPDRNGVQSRDFSFYSGKAPTRLSVALIMPVQPFADEVANHTCCDSHQKSNDDFHLNTPSHCWVQVGQHRNYNIQIDILLFFLIHRYFARAI